MHRRGLRMLEEESARVRIHLCPFPSVRTPPGAYHLRLIRFRMGHGGWALATPHLAIGHRSSTTDWRVWPRVVTYWLGVFSLASRTLRMISREGVKSERAERTLRPVFFFPQSEPGLEPGDLIRMFVSSVPLREGGGARGSVNLVMPLIRRLS